MDTMRIVSRIVPENTGPFTVNGAYGRISARPDGGSKRNSNDQLELTYHVDAIYFDRALSSVREEHESGFRLSTVRCMCACVCVGEQVVNEAFVGQLNNIDS